MRHRHANARNAPGHGSLRSAVGLIALLATTGAASEALAQSRAADNLRDHYRTYFRQAGLSDAVVSRHIDYEGTDGTPQAFNNGGAIQLSFGVMRAYPPGQGYHAAVSHIIFNDTNERICVRARVKDRNPYRLQRQTVNDEFAFIVEPHSNHVLFTYAGQYSSAADAPELRVGQGRDHNTVVVWRPDMRQPAGTGRRCGVTEPDFLQDALARTPTHSMSLRISSDLERRLGGSRD